VDDPGPDPRVSGAARADLEREAHVDLLARLEEVHHQLDDLSRSNGWLRRRRNQRRIMALNLAERLMLNQMGFETTAELQAWSAWARQVERVDQPDAAYDEFARTELDVVVIELPTWSPPASPASPEDAGAPDDLDLPYLVEPSPEAPGSGWWRRTR
jgi:hypothetical protein